MDKLLFSTLNALTKAKQVCKQQGWLLLSLNFTLCDVLEVFVDCCFEAPPLTLCNTPSLTCLPFLLKAVK